MQTRKFQIIIIDYRLLQQQIISYFAVTAYRWRATSRANFRRDRVFKKSKYVETLRSIGSWCTRDALWRMLRSSISSKEIRWLDLDEYIY